MSKSLRALAVLLFLAASFAFANTNDNGGLLGDGGGPVPTCRPGSDCQP